jgi:HAD superfamily hydrolase (TIGR01662 family)
LSVDRRDRPTADLYSVVVPTVGRPSLHALLVSLAGQEGRLPHRVVVVDDRPPPAEPLEIPRGVRQRLDVRVAAGLGRGPAAARNLGWRLTRTEWVAFLDDDVELLPGWAAALEADIAAAGPRVAATQGRLAVPLPADRRPTDWERSTAGLEDARWATADMAFRRPALIQVGGFDERFPRAYREDADLALRLRQEGWRLLRGSRTAVHPVRAAGPGVSVSVQRGNADDALMRRLHGPRWRQLAETGRGRLPWHVVTVVAGVTGAAAAVAAAGLRAGGSRPRGSGVVAAAAGAVWAALTADFARRRIVPGPRDRAEVGRMLWTSAAIPFAAVWHRARGTWVYRHAEPWPPPVKAVLFDRDGTLVQDVPYNGDPALVRPVEDARTAVERLREEGLKVGVISNQSGVARGLITHEQVDAVNAETERLLGPFDTWQVCPHGPDEGCPCRKPGPGMVLEAARRLRVRPSDCVVVGDIGSDMAAARAAGAAGILVPTAVTRGEEVAGAPVVARSLTAAVSLVLEGRRA